ncbi:hypothetical protein EV702DRAFT_1194109 [Suillus placidus]|uniref:Glutathione S-transferase UstS-like C-terminal domain-containing protein n=1 Tax=Suillus placidus TaxID=48579 RepID=A0A9P7A2M1_9AGAM|nr:hypothetical protein EV702DRAFT_1194109 [Suillus placidus]
MYTIHVLGDPITGALVDESLEIASYLEKTYTAKPIFPHGSEMLICVFDSAYPDDAHPICGVFRRTRSERLQLPWEEFSPEGPKRDGDRAYLEQGFNKGEMLREKSDGQWVMGDTFSYADIIVASRLFWYKRVLKEDEWAKVLDKVPVQQECHLA